ncbi:CRAL/TRIO domain-containing protein [Colletotrichum higginsianum]|uniref:CRAL-TRIO domain-containing protein C23B6.04c n=1 Tax=Colletotrichum higginsianum TaxID=80884 RepID=A0A4T0W1U9_9PEZI|nr:CRAL-TRIO domain-containing protein C23B6.04c [Colletotrichum higginsianum]GJC93362.1 CRAL/TRIO domain-containing protein [Colletotrichum higginsianum]
MASVADPTAASTGLQDEKAAAAAASPSSDRIKKLIASPPPASSIPPAPVLTPDQQSKYDGLLAQARAWTEVKCTSAGHAEKSGPLTDADRQWLTRECLLRYLRATSWNPKAAEKRLLETLAWRREYGVEALTPDHISVENETGKQVVLGFDNEARPCLYLSPGHQNTDPSPRQVQHLVFMLERVIELMPAGQEKVALLINFKSSKRRSNSAPSLGLAREVLHILQTHYPERLGRALIINVPWVVTGFFKLITPFIDPMTRDKLKFNEDMRQYVHEDQLWTEFGGGKLEFEYDHAVYWPVMNDVCKEKRDFYAARWVAGGKQVGELETYLAGAAAKGVGPGAATPPPPAAAAAAAAAVDAEAESTPVVQ